MGFYTRHLSEKNLRSIYDSQGKHGIYMTFKTADAVTTEDPFSSSVVELFHRRLSEPEMATELRQLFQSDVYERTILRRLSAFSEFKENGLEQACKMYPGEAEFIKNNVDQNFSDVKTALLKKL